MTGCAERVVTLCLMKLSIIKKMAGNGERKHSFEHNDHREDDGYSLKYFQRRITEEIRAMFMNFSFSFAFVNLHNFTLFVMDKHFVKKKFSCDNRIATLCLCNELDKYKNVAIAHGFSKL